MISNYFILNHVLDNKGSNYNETKPLIDFDDIDLQDSLWDAKPINPFPVITFAISDPSFYPDILNTWSNYLLFSKKMTDIMMDFNIRFELHKIRLIDKVPGNELSHPYKLFNILEMEDAIDKTESIIPEYSIKIIKIVIRKDFIDSPKPMFRLVDHPDLILMHGTLVDAFRKNNITGCDYLPVEKYQVGTEFNTDKLDALIKQFSIQSNRKKQ